MATTQHIKATAVIKTTKIEGVHTRDEEAIQSSETQYKPRN